MWEQKIYQSKVPVLGVFRNALQYTLVEFFLFSNKIPIPFLVCFILAIKYQYQFLSFKKYK